MKAILKDFTPEEKKAFIEKIRAEKQKDIQDTKTVNK